MPSGVGLRLFPLVVNQLFNWNQSGASPDVRHRFGKNPGAPFAFQSAKLLPGALESDPGAKRHTRRSEQEFGWLIFFPKPPDTIPIARERIRAAGLLSQ